MELHASSFNALEPWVTLGNLWEPWNDAEFQLGDTQTDSKKPTRSKDPACIGLGPQLSIVASRFIHSIVVLGSTNIHPPDYCCLLLFKAVFVRRKIKDAK